MNKAPEITIVRTRNNSVTRDRTPTIAARVKDETPVAKENIRVYINDRRVNNFAFSPTTGLVTYTCPAMRLGWHRVKVEAMDASDARTIKSWRFRVVRR